MRWPPRQRMLHFAPRPAERVHLVPADESPHSSPRPQPAPDMAPTLPVVPQWRPPRRVRRLPSLWFQSRLARHRTAAPLPPASPPRPLAALRNGCEFLRAGACPPSYRVLRAPLQSGGSPRFPAIRPPRRIPRGRVHAPERYARRNWWPACGHIPKPPLPGHRGQSPPQSFSVLDRNSRFTSGVQCYLAHWTLSVRFAGRERQ